MLLSPAHVHVNYSRSTNVAAATHTASNLYRVARGKALWGSVGSRLRGQSRQLLSLQAVLAEQGARNEQYLRSVEVPIEQIRGSENRSTDFDIDFRPIQEHTRDRWLRVAAAFQLDIPLPPVELIQVGEYYFVRDGHHRISVAKARGQEFVEAHVTRLEVQ